MDNLVFMLTRYGDNNILHLYLEENELRRATISLKKILNI